MSDKPSMDDLLADMPPKHPRSLISQNQPLADKIVEFLDLKLADDDRVRGLTLSWFYQQKLREVFDGPKHFDSVRKYVADELRRDHKTGAAL